MLRTQEFEVVRWWYHVLSQERVHLSQTEEPENYSKVWKRYIGIVFRISIMTSTTNNFAFRQSLEYWRWLPLGENVDTYFWVDIVVISVDKWDDWWQTSNDLDPGKTMQDQWRVVLKTSGLSTDVTLPKRHGEVEFLNDFPNWSTSTNVKIVTPLKGWNKFLNRSWIAWTYYSQSIGSMGLVYLPTFTIKINEKM